MYIDYTSKIRFILYRTYVLRRPRSLTFSGTSYTVNSVRNFILTQITGRRLKPFSLRFISWFGFVLFSRIDSKMECHISGQSYVKQCRSLVSGITSSTDDPGEICPKPTSLSYIDLLDFVGGLI